MTYLSGSYCAQLGPALPTNPACCGLFIDMDAADSAECIVAVSGDRRCIMIFFPTSDGYGEYSMEECVRMEIENRTIPVPCSFLDLAGIEPGGRATLLGNCDHLELWNTQAWEETELASMADEAFLPLLHESL